MKVLAILGIIVMTKMAIVMIVTMVHDILPMSIRPEWLEDLYELIW